MSPCSVQGDPDLRHPKNPPGIHLSVPAPGDTQRQQGGDEAQKCPLKPQGSRSQEEPPPSPSLPLSGMQRHPPGWMDGGRGPCCSQPACPPCSLILAGGWSRPSQMARAASTGGPEPRQIGAGCLQRAPATLRGPGPSHGTGGAEPRGAHSAAPRDSP